MSYFPLGRIVATQGALDALAAVSVEPSTLIRKHANKEWAELDEEDRAGNERAIANGQRIVSTFCLSEQTKVYVITEHDRSTTTVLLPSEY